MKSFATIILSTFVISSPLLAATSIHCSLSAPNQNAELHLTIDPISGKLSYQSLVDGQSGGGSLSGTCHPLLGGSSILISKYGTVQEELKIVGQSTSVCRLNAHNQIALILEKSWLNTDPQWQVKKFSVAHQFSTGEIERTEPVEILGLQGAVCTFEN